MTQHGTVTLNGGANLTDKLKKIQATIERVRRAKEARAEDNADIQAARESMTAIGIPKAAFDMALRYLDWEPEKRQGFDVAYALVREAGGLPLQGDLFMQAEKLSKDVDAKKEAEKPSAKDIADRMFEQATKGKKADPKKKAEPAKEVPQAEEEEAPSVDETVGKSVSDFAAETEAAANGK